MVSGKNHVCDGLGNTLLMNTVDLLAPGVKTLPNQKRRTREGRLGEEVPSVGKIVRAGFKLVGASRLDGSGKVIDHEEEECSVCKDGTRMRWTV